MGDDHFVTRFSSNALLTQTFQTFRAAFLYACASLSLTKSERGELLSNCSLQRPDGEMRVEIFNCDCDDGFHSESY